MADPTIAMRVAQAQAPQGAAVNPLELMQGVMGLQRSSLALQQERSTLQARQQLGEIMANSPDAQSGLDIARQNANIAGFAPEVLGANIANATNQVALTQAQQQLAARQKAGQIMARAPSVEVGVAQLLSDPETAGFAPDVVNTMQAISSSQTGQAGEQQSQAISGQGQLFKVLTGAVQNPGMAKPLADAALDAMSPSARAANSQAYTNIVKSLTDGLPDDPVAAQQEYSKRLSGILLGAGIPADQIRASTGAVAPSVQMLPVGEGGAQVPVQIGGGVTSPNTPQIMGQPGASVQGQTQTQQTANAARGGVAGKIDDEMTAQSALQPALQRIDIIQGMLKNFQSGGGADAMAKAAQGLQALQKAGLPISDDTINKVGNGSLSATQVFNAEIKPLVIQSLKSDIQGTGRAMRPEVETYLQSMDATTDPAALMKLTNQARYNMQVMYDQSQKYVDFKEAQRQNDPSIEKYKDPADFYAWYNKNYKPEELPQATGGGVNLAPTSNAGVKGADKSNRPALDSFFK